MVCQNLGVPVHHDAGKLLEQLRAAEGRLAQLAVPPVVLALAAQDALLVRHVLVDVLTAARSCFESPCHD